MEGCDCSSKDFLLEVTSSMTKSDSKNAKVLVRIGIKCCKKNHLLPLNYSYNMLKTALARFKSWFKLTGLFS